MANINETFFNDLATGATWSAGVAFKRSNPLPLDRYSVFETKALAETYATTNAVAYPGQVIAVLENNEMVVYVLQEVANEVAEGEEQTYSLGLVRVGTVPTGDGKTIKVTEDGQISLLVADGDADAGSQLTLQADGTIKWVKPDTTTAEGQANAIKALQSQVGQAGNDNTAASGLYAEIDAVEERVGELEAKEDKDTTYSIKEGEKVLSLDGTAFGTTLKLAYADNKIKLLGVNDTLISEFDASTFVADGVLEDADYDADTRELVFTWNIKTGETEDGQPIYKTDRVNVGDLVDTYTNGLGLNLENNEFSVKVKSDDKFLTIDADGIHTEGIDDAIAAAEGRAATAAQGKADAAKEAAIANTDTKLANYYNKTQVDDLIKDFATDDEVAEAVAAEAEIARAAEEANAQSITEEANRAKLAEKANADAITAIKNGDSIDTFKKVEEALAGKQASGDYATNAALSEVNAKAVKNAEDISSASSTINNHGERITSLEQNTADLSTVKGNVETNTQNIAKLTEDLNTAKGTIASHGQSITDLTAKNGEQDTAIAEVKATADAAATKIALEAETKRATEAEEANAAAIKAITDNYLTSDDRTALEDLITEKADQTAFDAEVKRATAAEEANATAIAKLAQDVGNVTNIMNFRGVVTFVENSDVATEAAKVITDPKDGDVIIYGEKEYVYNNGAWVLFGDASGNANAISALTTRVEANETAVKTTLPNAITKAQEDANKYADDEIAKVEAKLPVVAQQDTAGLLKGTANKVNVADGQIVSITTDALINGTEVLILNGGTANTVL